MKVVGVFLYADGCARFENLHALDLADE